MPKHPSGSGSLLARSILALTLMVGFYLLALGLALGLLFIPYAELVYAHRLHIKLVLICVVAGGAILWAVLPRIDRFEAPGPQLTAAEHPRLFAVIAELSAATEQAMPAEVYLVPDVNAFVTQRGGIMGLGSRRVMGLGLPVMQALSEAQLRAVIAHEFGHFHGGDVQLGPFIYKTRSAIIRTVVTLGRHGSMLQKIFIWYGEMFIKVTHAISRQQELAADALAARVVGARPLVEGLKRTHAAALAYQMYWHEDVLPALGSGWRPPLAAGFAHFLGAKRARTAMEESLTQALSSAESDPYDTHPPLRERIEAVAGLPEHSPAGTDADQSAVALLSDLAALERALLSFIAQDKAGVQQLKPIGWTEIADHVHLPAWRTLVADLQFVLAGRTLASAAADQAFQTELGRRAAGERAAAADADALARLGRLRLAMVVTLGLIEHGFVLDTSPGEHVTVTRAAIALCPFEIALDPQRGLEVLRDAWHAAGLTDMDLGAIAARARSE
jgi:heat shock protein HtpX